MWRVDGVADAGISAADRGLAYGDGVFRTLRLEGGRPLQWLLHYQRLVDDAARLGLQCPSAGLWLDDIAALAAQHGDGVIKCLLTRGVAGRGYATPGEASRPTRLVIWSAAPQYPPEYASTGIALRLCQLRLGHQPRLAGIKHLNRLENVLARAEWNDAEWAEGLLLDVDGHMVEGVMSNLLWRSGEQWYTPRLDRCGVAGITRDRLIAHLQAAGQATIETLAAPTELERAEEAFVCNSVIGLWPIRAFGQRRWTQFPTLQRLHHALTGDA